VKDHSKFSAAREKWGPPGTIRAGPFRPARGRKARASDSESKL
jgi:hypothetical protein